MSCGSLFPVMEIRARLIWRRLHGRRGKLEAIAVALLFVLAVPLGIAVAGFVAAGSYKAVHAGPGMQAAGLVGIFFGIWQAWTAVALTLNDREILDLRRFLLYPVGPGRVYFFGLLSGLLADPIALFWMLLLGGAFVGAALARPGIWLAGLALTLLLFALGTVFLVALVQEALGRVLQSRRLRELAVGVLILAAAALVGTLVAGAHAFSLWRALAALARLRGVAFPAALAFEAARRLYAGRALASLPWLALLLAANGLTGFAAFRLALGSARSGGQGGSPVPFGFTARLPFLGGRFGALLEKDLKLLGRHPLARTYGLIVPGFSAIAAFAIGSRVSADAREVVRAVPLFGFALYTHLVLQPFWLNAFGWERGGVRLLFLAPVAGARVILSKNAALALFSLSIFAAAAALAVAIGERPPAWALVGAPVLHLAAAPVLFGLGNLMTLLNPKAGSFGVQRGANLSALSGLAGLVLTAVTGGVMSLPVLLALAREDPWLLPAGWGFIGLAALAVYWKTLPGVGRLWERRREDLLDVVCGDER